MTAMNAQELQTMTVLSETRRLVSDRKIESDYPPDCPFFEPTVRMIVQIHQKIGNLAGVEASLDEFLTTMRRTSVQAAKMADDTEPLAKFVLQALRNVVERQ